MIGVAAQERRAAGHHVLVIFVGHLEAQHLRVEPAGAFDVGDIQRDMADFPELERRTELPWVLIGDVPPVARL